MADDVAQISSWKQMCKQVKTYVVQTGPPVKIFALGPTKPPRIMKKTSLSTCVFLSMENHDYLDYNARHSAGQGQLTC